MPRMMPVFEHNRNNSLFFGSPFPMDIHPENINLCHHRARGWVTSYTACTCLALNLV
jgi:hypothetical protein